MSAMDPGLGQRGRYGPRGPSAVRLVWVYPDLLSTYGDRGNLLVLARRARLRGFPVEIAEVNSDQRVPVDGDIYLLGGGEDLPQVLAARRLRADGGLPAAAQRGAVVFAVCAGYQITWFNEAMRRRGIRQAQVAAYIGASSAAVSRWATGGSRPDPESCLKLAELFHEDLAKVYALAGHPSTYVPEERRQLSVREAAAEFLAELPIEIPVHEQTASAGLGEEVIEYAYWDAARAAGRNIVGLRVRGSSMEPEVLDGDTIFIDRNLAPAAGKLVVASVGDQVYIKRYEQRGALTVLAGNNGSVIDARDAKIEGVVIQLSRSL